MKRSMKIIAAAAALCLCLVLTGCYVPPDDVNQNSGNGTSNSVPFLTREPTATATVTVTPDTVVISTQSTQGNNPAAPTISLPSQTTDDGWTSWGSTPIPTGVTIQLGGPTETPDPNATIAVVTSAPPSVTPTPAVVTPTPTPPSLQLGFTGSDAVRSLQKRLKELGYYSGSVDGDFGPATEKAVKEFQKANGLTADGKAGSKTLAKMNAKTAISYKQAHATPTPKPTKKPTPTPKPTPKATATPNLSKDYYLELGVSGSRVKTLQKRLIELGWLDGKVTGKYDEATEAAVRAFQRKTSGLWEDGIAGPETLKAIYASGAAKASKAAATTGEKLVYGDEGSEVKRLQRRLRELGYLGGEADGKFGVATEAAVIAFQKNNGLTADGKAGPITLTRLYSSSAKKSSGNAVNVNTSGRDTTDIASTGYETLQNGSKGSAVRKLQERLKKLDYYTGNVDGTFGDETEAAVMAFQLRNHLTVDGKAGPATQRVLYGSGASSAVTYSALRDGDTGTAVRNLQYTLYELGYYDGSIDGVYGQTTSDAVRAFQIQNNVSPVDGIAGSKTLAAMYSSDAKAATASNPNYGTVYPGATGDIVVQIQECLVDAGCLTEGTYEYGVYDDATVQGVKNYQQKNGLTTDGVAGGKTLEMLFAY